MTNEFDRLRAAANKAASGAKKTDFPKDERYWTPTQDEAGNAFAIIRFLPAPEVDGENALPWIHYFDHFFRGPTGSVYSELSLTTPSLGVKETPTLGGKDPVSESNSILWNSTTDDEGPARKTARDRKRRENYVFGIQVIQDSGNPENNGQIFLYRAGKKIFNKVQEAFNPEYDENGNPLGSAKYNPTNAFNPFDLEKGANFRLRVKRQGEFPNYDSSTFDSPGPFMVGGRKVTNTEIQPKLHSLKQEIVRRIKSYDELKSELIRVLGENPFVSPVVPPLVAASKPVIVEGKHTPPKKAAEVVPSLKDEDEDDDAIMRHFKNVAELE